MLLSISRCPLFFLATIGLFAALTGCDDELPRAAVTGQVTVGGEPLKAGRVLFLPEPPLAGPTAAATITDGQYKLARRDGPIIGRQRVEVEADLPLGFALDDEAAFAKRRGAPLPPHPIPVEFNQQSTLTTDIQAGENVFDVAVPATRRGFDFR